MSSNMKKSLWRKGSNQSLLSKSPMIELFFLPIFFYVVTHMLCMYVLHYLFYMRLIRNSERGEKKNKNSSLLFLLPNIKSFKAFQYLCLWLYEKAFFFFFFPQMSWESSLASLTYCMNQQDYFYSNSSSFLKVELDKLKTAKCCPTT